MIKKLFYSILLFFCAFYCQQSWANEPIKIQRLIGTWKYVSHEYRKVGRYGAHEVDEIKSTLLYFGGHKIYFANISFIDTCFYTELIPRAFFDRNEKKPSYFMDGPLALKYTKQQLAQFTRIDLNCKKNDFGTFYLNADTLILNSYGGVTFFFTKSTCNNQK
jgi:hypothetical protein